MAVVILTRSWRFGSSSSIEGAAGLLGALVGKQAFWSGLGVRFELLALHLRHALFSLPVVFLAGLFCVWLSTVRQCAEANMTGRALGAGARWRAMPLGLLPYLCKMFVCCRLINVGVKGTHCTDSGVGAGIGSRLDFVTLDLYAQLAFDWLEAAPSICFGSSCKMLVVMGLLLAGF